MLTLRHIVPLVLLVVVLEARPPAKPVGSMKRKYPPPGSGFKTRDIETNLTMDAIMTRLLGGVQAAASSLMADKGLIRTELDLMLTPEQYSDLHGSGQRSVSHSPGARNKRKAIRDTVFRWTDGEIPYAFADTSFSLKDKFMMIEAMTEWERYTCLNFRPAKSADPNSIHFINGDSCSSQLGMVGGKQYVTLVSPGCRYRALYLHEMAHAIGVIHEHQRPDRDEYIDVIMENVNPGLLDAFTKYSLDTVTLADTAYEYASLMHYSSSAFSHDGKAITIRTKDPAREEEIGKPYLKELAFNDAKVVSNIYRCSEKCAVKPECRDGGFVDQNCHCVCPDGSRECEVGYPGAPGDCPNVYDDWQCSIWANSGQCDRNKPFMSLNCRRACDLCPKTSEENEPACEDVYVSKKCETWKERGDCVANEWWMTRNCRKTCNACISKDKRVESNCTNEHTDESKCDQWAADGECVINKMFMLTKCRRSCQTCHQESPSLNETEICEDVYYDKDSCKKWAGSGECQNNPVWMLANCMESCGQCGDDKVTIKGPCIDTDEGCANWAKTGECQKNPEWMKKNCMLSCEECTPETGSSQTTPGTTTVVTGDCEDLYEDQTKCQDWASTGECDINPVWMNRNCRKSCGKCGTETTPPVTEGTCEDTYHDRTACKKWAASNHCSINPSFMLSQCKQSCGVCGDVITPPPPTQGPCINTYYDLECDRWAETGHCDINPGWMHENCQKACKLCNKETVPTAAPPTPKTPECACDLYQSGAIKPEFAVMGAVFIVLVKLLL